MTSKVQHATTLAVVTSVSARMDISLLSRCINVKVIRIIIYSIMALMHSWDKNKEIKVHRLHMTTLFSVNERTQLRSLCSSDTASISNFFEVNLGGGDELGGLPHLLKSKK